MLNVGILLCKEKTAVIPGPINQNDGFRSYRYCTHLLSCCGKDLLCTHPFHLAFLSPSSSPLRTNYDLAGDWPSLQPMALHPYESLSYKPIVDRSLGYLLASPPWVSARSWSIMSLKS
ncbi:uncharacterized protein CLUP02_14891 [Colletotrichum lupini]|uniref:Uncharacterized protein n=1 Tax=Colletotrichum lupini TaxID=145971 RepID=A0A9Q8WNH3_9PEZI|nr:uncharacterized protein CLUP02_14891 [Colletotrichum lupini]UQC89362.1 hypothetical protein CLUP02_14891 [Colletotrichum lupini]